MFDACQAADVKGGFYYRVIYGGYIGTVYLLYKGTLRPSFFFGSILYVRVG